MPRGKRTKLHTGIYKDAHGYAVIVAHKGQRIEKRYPKDSGPQFLKNERTRLLHDLTTRARKHAPGTLRADVLAYLKTLPEGRAKTTRADELDAWVKVLGDFPRTAITQTLIQTTLAGWATPRKVKPFAPSTLNHRRQALRTLYKALDGPHAPTPCDHIKRLPERREIRAVPHVVIVAILRQMRPCKSSARLKVLARTGLPHAQIGRLTAKDVDLVNRTVHVTPRRKGAGTPARTLPLTHSAVRAFKLFARVNAWGPFSSQSLYKSFQLAVTKAKEAWKGPWTAGHIRPYDLRHAFLTEVYRRTKDLRATAELGMHSDLTMTARYAEAAVSATASAARDLMDTRVALRRNRRK